MKAKKSNRTRIIGLRLLTSEYAKLEKEWNASTCRKLSDYVRKRLFQKPIVTTYRDASLDDFMIETIQLKTELNAIGSNFNQAVKKLHTLQQIPEFKDWIINYDLQNKILFNKVEEIKKHIQKISEKWLQ
ncbi:plasmid mobilization relaxosome protein MobC [Flavobacterium sp. ST-87]|uniref:Plasmid mobilization relaxosome protein MobC n=1 Tax=Flavobacterium plantiphilum TaxID=3163297 RepID=A0ABW8XPK7_9FLAO